MYSLFCKRSLFSLRFIRFEYVVAHAQCKNKHVCMHGRGLNTDERVVTLYDVCRFRNVYLQQRQFHTIKLYNI